MLQSGKAPNGMNKRRESITRGAGQARQKAWSHCGWMTRDPEIDGLPTICDLMVGPHDAVGSSPSRAINRIALTIGSEGRTGRTGGTNSVWRRCPALPPGSYGQLLLQWQLIGDPQALFARGTHHGEDTLLDPKEQCHTLNSAPILVELLH